MESKLSSINSKQRHAETKLRQAGADELWFYEVKNI